MNGSIVATARWLLLKRLYYSLNISLLDPIYNDLFCNIVFKSIGSNKVFLISDF